MEVYARNSLWRRKLGTEVEELDEQRDNGRHALGIRILPQMSLSQ